MEERHFKWFIHTISQHPNRINLLDTLLIKNSRCELWAFTDAQGLTRRKPVIKNGQNLHINDALAFFAQSYQAKANLMPQPTNKICYTTSQNKRNAVKIDMVPRLSSTPAITNQIHIIQRYIPLYNDRQSSYILLLNLINGRFQSEFWRRDMQSDKRKVVRNELLPNMIDMSKIIINALEQIKDKRVVSIELEFIVDQAMKV